MSRAGDLIKRALDVMFGGLLLIVLAPVLAAVALAVRIRLGSPVLFRQLRPGLGSRPFTIYKFRTMRDAHDADGRDLPDEERITPLGARLRSTSLDELPELVNVVRGDMSLVGPRPLLVEYLLRYSPAQARRHDVRPGITGWAQVNGRNELPWEERFDLDLHYVDHRSLRLDLRILVLTATAVMRRDGISTTGHATAPVYTGHRRPEDAGR